MKKVRFALIAFNSFLALCLMATLMLPTSCSKEEIELLDDPASYGIQLDSADLANLAAFFDGIRRILYVDPTYVTETLISMEADLTGPQSGVGMLPCYDGERRYTEFKIELVSPDFLVQEALQRIEELNQIVRDSLESLRLQVLHGKTQYGRVCQFQQNISDCKNINRSTYKSYQTVIPGINKCMPSGNEESVCTEFVREVLALETKYKGEGCSGDVADRPRNIRIPALECGN